jgi:hypothetical protein
LKPAKTDVERSDSDLQGSVEINVARAYSVTGVEEPKGEECNEEKKEI